MSKQTEITCGIHAVRHALNNGSADVLEMWVEENKKSARAISEILGIAKSSKISVQFVANKTLDKLTHQANHQGVVIRRKVTSIANKNGSELGFNNG